VVQTRRCPGLPEHSGPEDGPLGIVEDSGELDGLHGHVALQQGVVSPPHDPEPTTAHLLAQQVTVGQTLVGRGFGRHSSGLPR